MRAVDLRRTAALAHVETTTVMGIEQELALARQAQADNNPGRARVCARRAAGLAIRGWYQAREGGGWGGDAMKQLQRLGADPAVPEAVRQAAARLLAKVDHDHKLPFDDDPVVDAGRIIAHVGG